MVFLYWDVTDLLIKPYVKGMKEQPARQMTIIPGFMNIDNIDIQ